MKKIKKTISVLLIILLSLGHLWPRVVLAEEIEQQVDNNAEVTNEIDSTANTGENVIGESDAEFDSQPSGETESAVEPEPEATTEPEPEATDGGNPEPTPTPGTEIDNSAEVTNDVDSTAETGDNAIEEPTSTVESTLEEESVCEVETEGDCTEEILESTGEPTSAEIDTGDAVSVVEVENSVNTTEVGSEILYQTLNIFVSNDIDLSVSPLAIAETVFGENGNSEPVVNVAVLDVNNIAYLSNDIVSFANSGDNSIEGGKKAVIDTGDAYSIVSLLNKVNTTIVDSTIHIVTINIFGDVKGNILLPELSSESIEACCGETTQISNSAIVENNVGSLAVSGQNTITTKDMEIASITTGQASSAVNLINIVNTSLIGVNFYRLFINTLGTWAGDFLGWDSFTALVGGGSLSLSSTQTSQNGNGQCPGCVGDVSIGNEAYVTNNVSSTAKTGSNSIEGDGGNISTGNAYSSVSIINIVNSSIINSVGFFGFINIFGFLEGDIGGASLFASEEPEPKPEAEVEETSEGEPGPSVREAGGELDIYQYNNVGAHVLPGDTVTFFVTVRNPGTGRVYDAVLDLGLIKDGVDVGGGIFELGEIKQGEGVKITTGLVLSEDAELGDYIAHAVVSGYVGPDNDLISAYSDSFFKIAGFSSLPLMPGIVEEVKAIEPKEEVLGAITVPAGLTLEEKFGLFLLALLLIYLPAKGYQRREELAVAFSQSKRFLGSKSAALRSFLTSFFA